MAGSRKSTPSRARSSSVTSNVSTASAKPSKATPKSPKATPKSPKSPKSPAKTPKSPKASTKTPLSPSKEPKAGPATPRKSKSSAASKAALEQSLTPSQLAAIASRPDLKDLVRNNVLPNEDVAVKLQVIERESADIIIGRVKLPAPTTAGHGFILKRFDTGAIAASSMFRCAFPTASVEQEAKEMEYLEKRYDTWVANGGHAKVYKRPRGRPSKKVADGDEEMPYDEKLPAGSTGIRLQGTWIPATDALHVASEYGLERWARPLIEAKANLTTEGALILIPSATDKVSTPTSGRSKKMLQQVILESPSGKGGAKVRAVGSGIFGKGEAKASSGAGLTDEQIAKQIKESQALAKNIQASGTPSKSSASLKRRAAHQTPSASNNDHDEEDYENANVVLRSFRRGQRVARRRPIATTAGALGAVGAVGAGTLAWVAGGNLDVAVQMVQQGVSNLSSWFFF